MHGLARHLTGQGRYEKGTGVPGHQVPAHCPSFLTSDSDFFCLCPSIIPTPSWWNGTRQHLAALPALHAARALPARPSQPLQQQPPRHFSPSNLIRNAAAAPQNRAWPVQSNPTHPQTVSVSVSARRPLPSSRSRPTTWFIHPSRRRAAPRPTHGTRSLSSCPSAFRLPGLRLHRCPPGTPRAAPIRAPPAARLPRAEARPCITSPHEPVKSHCDLLHPNSASASLRSSIRCVQSTYPLLPGCPPEAHVVPTCSASSASHATSPPSRLPSHRLDRRPPGLGTTRPNDWSSLIDPLLVSAASSRQITRRLLALERC